MSENYGVKDIKTLEGIEAIRLRPGMYIGSIGPDGVRHITLEIISNVIDEYLKDLSSQAKQENSNFSGFDAKRGEALFTSEHIGKKGKAISGVKTQNLDSGDKVASIAVIPAEEMESEQEALDF